jgi:succinoglycan biosynthesis transport protein ExoP
VTPSFVPSLLTEPGNSTGLLTSVADETRHEATFRNLRYHLWVLWRHRWLSIGCFAATLGLTLLMIVLAPRLFTASTRLQVTQRSPIQLRLEDSVLRLGDGDQGAATNANFLVGQMGVLQSRDLAERVIRERRLAENGAFLNSSRKPQALLSVTGSLMSPFRPRGWEPSLTSALDEQGPSTSPTDPQLIDRYMDYLSVRDVRGSDLIDVSFTTPSAELSAFLAAAHTQAYLEVNEEQRRSTDVAAKDFLEQQIRQSETRVQSVEAALASFAAEHPSVAANEEQNSIGQRIEELSRLLAKAEADHLTLQSRYDLLSNPGNDILMYFLDRPGIQKLHLSLLDLRVQVASRQQRLGPKHPEMIELRQLEAEIKAQLRDEVRSELDAVRTRLVASWLRTEALQDELSSLEASAIELGSLGSRYERLKNDVATARALHGSLLKQQMETAVNAQLVASNVRVIERAEVPQRPSKPKVTLDLLLGVLAALVLAVAVPLGREYFDSSVKSSEDVVEFLGLPTLATIPNFALAREGQKPRLVEFREATRNGRHKVAPSNDSELVVVRQPWSKIAEAFRSMRTAVLFSVPGQQPKVIAVTSALIGEGKTVGSLNLAATLSDAGARVVLVDADLRHPRCHRALRVKNERGLSDCLTGREEIGNVIHQLHTPLISFIPAGRQPTNPAELVGSTRMCEVLEYLKLRYEFVILDTPPVLPVTDAVLLARKADGVLLVVKGNATARELVQRARDQLQLAGAQVLGVVVNNVGIGWVDFYLYDPYRKTSYAAERQESV